MQSPDLRTIFWVEGKTSRWFLGWLLLLYLLPVVTFLLTLPFVFACLLACLFIGWLVVSLRRHHWRTLPQSWLVAGLHPNGSWELELRSGKRIKANETHVLYLSTWLIVGGF